MFKHFWQKHNAIVKRVHLHRRSQQEHETVQEYADTLKQLATNCGSAITEYKDRMKDILAAGI